MENGNFKVRCVDDNGSTFTKGDIHEIIDGHIVHKDGYRTKQITNSLEELNEYMIPQFELIEENPISKTLTIPVKVEVGKVSEDGIVTLLVNDQPMKIHIDTDNSTVTKRVEISKKKKSNWTKWIESSDHTYFYKTNYKKIIVKKGELKSKASCNKNDKFDLTAGIDLCLARIAIKDAEIQLALNEAILESSRANVFNKEQDLNKLVSRM